MKISVLTLFPEFYNALDVSIIGRARAAGIIDIAIYNIRDYSQDKHKKCDDYPFGGGAGMVMTPQPLKDAILSADAEHKAIRIYLSPRGATLNQAKVVELSQASEICLINGSYEGIDQRIIDNYVDCELSIGDYVLTSGDLASLVVINAVARYLPSVLGSESSTQEESFSNNLLEYPQYTRPQDFEGYKVPDVLLSGNHRNIELWRQKKSEEITCKIRPDLIK